MPETTFELKRKLLRLEALYDVGRDLSELRDEDGLLEELLHRAMSVLDASSGFALSLDDNHLPQGAHTVGLRSGVEPEALLSEDAVRKALVSRQLISTFSPSFPGGRGGAQLVAPMVTGEKLLGAIGVVGKESRTAEPDSFDEDDGRFLMSLALIAAAAIENTRNLRKLDLMRESLEDENRLLRERMLREFSDRLMIGESEPMQRVVDLIARVADSPASVLIRGESGTGKEMVARLIHGNSPRRDRPFVAINCAALPETLLESELFGIERGVATGVEARPGRFELAQGGTVFLDEIGDIPMTLQAKLLRVLQEREVEKLGARRRIPVDVRILTATHRNLEEMIEEGTFRQDLYYRLKVVEIALPPLRERREDIPKLVRYFLDKYGPREQMENVRLSPAALQKIMSYPFPGNVRELENLIEGALALTVDPVIDADDLTIPGNESTSLLQQLADDLPPLREVERRYIARVLEETGGNMARTARILGIDRKTLYRRRAESNDA